MQFRGVPIPTRENSGLSLLDARFRTGAEVDIVSRRFCILISGLTIVAALSAPVRLAGADLTPTVRIVLQIPVRSSSVPLHLVIRAKNEMTRIYRDIGVTVSWIDPASAASQRDPIESPAAMRPAFGLVVLPEEVAERLTVAPDALGGAVGTRDSGGRLAYVFYDRVARIAGTYLNPSRDRPVDLDTVIVLAHAMAHEVGHLLLPHGHSDTGLMRADWDADDLRGAVNGELTFTAGQAESIRRLLAEQDSE